MNKKLPAIYRSKGTLQSVNQEIFYSFSKRQEATIPLENNKEETIYETLDKIFKRRGYSFNVAVHIKLKDRELDTFLAARTKNTIITLDDEVIPIASIIKLQIKKP